MLKSTLRPVIGTTVTGIFLALLSVTIAAAQTEIGGATLNGTISDPAGAVVPDAMITVTEQSSGYTRVLQSNNAGLYNMHRVPVGVYLVSVEKAGFKRLMQQDVTLQVGAVLTLDFKLEVGEIQEIVTVTAEAPLVETTRSTSASSITQEAVDNLPVNGRNFIDFTVLTPGVVKDPSSGGDLSFAGQRGPANTLLVDGADSNNLFFGQAVGRTGFRPLSYSEEAVQEFQVNNAGYAAEVGRASGGAVNLSGPSNN